MENTGSLPPPAFVKRVEAEDKLAMFTNATEGIRSFSAASFTYLKHMLEMFSERLDSSPFRRDPSSQCLQSTVDVCVIHMCLYAEEEGLQKKIWLGV
jgi:hypothetical protein